MKLTKHGTSHGVYVEQKTMNSEGYFDKQFLAIKLKKINKERISDYWFTSKLMWVSRSKYFIIVPKYVRERYKLMQNDYIEIEVKEVK